MRHTYNVLVLLLMCGCESPAAVVKELPYQPANSCKTDADCGEKRCLPDPSDPAKLSCSSPPAPKEQGPECTKLQEAFKKFCASGQNGSMCQAEHFQRVLNGTFNNDAAAEQECKDLYSKVEL